MFNFLHIRFCELQKASGINTHENATRYCAGPAYYDVPTDVYCSNKPAAVAPKGNHHPSFLRFWNWAEETVDAAKIVAAQKMLETETQQTFSNGLLGFITLGIYTRWKRVCIAHAIIYELPIDMGNSICTAH